MKVPEQLKAWLVINAYFVKNKHEVLRLPAGKSVDTIFQEYLISKGMNGSSTKEKFLVKKILAIIQQYFNRTFYHELLSEFENLQYSDILATYTGVKMSQVYGATHLLRLLVEITSCLSCSSLQEKSLASLAGHVYDLLKYS